MKWGCIESINNLQVLETGLLKVYKTEKGEKVVDARELWEGVGSKQDFSTWIKKRLDEVDAVENVDFITFHKKMEREIGATKRIEYILKLDIAKEMAMLERNEIGKKYRRYLIEIEKKYKELNKQDLQDSYTITDPIERAKRWIEEETLRIEQSKELIKKQETINVLTPKAEYFDAIVEAELNINFRDSAKELNIKEKVFIKFLLDKGYVYRDSKNKLKPYSQDIPELFVIKEYVNKYTGFAGNRTLLTPKGRETFRLLIKTNK